MPRVPKASPKGRKKKIITAILVVALLIAAAGAGVYWRWHQNQNSSGTGSNGGPASDGQSDGLNQNNLPASVKNAQNLAASGNYSQSNQEIAASIATSSSNDEKYELYIQQGINAENQSQWNDAITSYKSALALKKTSTVYTALGRASEAKGDKGSALSYYQQALPLLDTKDPMYAFEKSQLEDKIKALGG